MNKTCTICGEEINKKRLKLLPHTTTCVKCSSECKKSINDVKNSAIVQHTGGLHEKYLKEEDVDE